MSTCKSDLMWDGVVARVGHLKPNYGKVKFKRKVHDRTGEFYN